MAYTAFVVGVNTLGLKYCARDAQRLKASLEQCGYETILPGNDKPRLQAAYDSVIDNAAQIDTLLLYFSGHGLLERGDLWLLLADDGNKLANKININQLLGNLSDCRASNKLVILDCCSAAQGIRELRIELSDRYLVLAASDRLEKSKELEALQASFLTHALCEALDNPSEDVLESGKSLSVQRLHNWLSEEAKKYNGKENTTQVPVPRLYGSHADFPLVVFASPAEGALVRITPNARRFRTVEQRYRELLLDTCDIVSLANLPEQDRHLAIRPLELRRLYVPLRAWVDVYAGEETKEIQWDEIEKRHDAGLNAHPQMEGFRDRQRAPVGERLTEAKRLVVLGDPGAGKTTLTRWIATAYLLRLRGDANWKDMPDVMSLPDADWLPVIVRCRDLDPTCITGTLDDILSHTLRKAEMTGSEATLLQDVLRERFQAGTALLILDGLDEITDPTLRARFCQQLEQIHLAHPNAPMIVTSRIVGYREMGFRLGRGFEHVTLADLEPREKDDFARRWCDLTELPERRAEATRDLIHDVHSTDRIERMTGNPMLLTTMALVKRKVGKLPSRRADLYGEAVQVLLNWRREVDQPLDAYETLPQLEYVAYAMCDQGVQQLRREEILNLITQMRAEYPNVHQARNHSPEEFLSRLEARTGLLMEAGRTRHLGLEEMVYEFRHLTFQEYLTARALVDGHFHGRRAENSLAEHVAPLAGRTAELAFTEGGQKEVAVVENWREALRLCVAICRDDDVDRVIRAIATPLEGEPPITSRARAIVAALCIADEPNVSEVLARDVLEFFSSQISERDRNFGISSGVHVAAASIAESRWAMVLCQCLVTQFAQQGPLRRDYWGDIAGLVNASIPLSETGAVSGWWAKQTTALRDGTELDAIQAALGIAAMVGTRGTAQVTPELIASLLRRLSTSPSMAHAAAEALAYLNAGLDSRGWKPSSENIEELVGFISNRANDPEAVRFLTVIMAHEKVVHASVLLVKWLDNASIELARSVINALQYIGGERAVELLLTLLDHTDSNVRVAAARALSGIGGESALSPLINRLDDSDADMRSAAAEALGTIDSDIAVSPLMDRLEDNDATVRDAAAEALGKIGSARPVESLIARLEDAEWTVRRAAAEALGRIGSPRAVEPLMARLDDTARTVRREAAEALGNIGSDQALEALIGGLDDVDAYVRGTVADAVGKIGGERAVEPLIARLEDVDWSVRTAAAEALRSIDSERGAGLLIARLEDADAHARGVAAEALGTIGRESALEPLIARLEDVDAYVRNSAAEGLGKIGSARAVDPLLSRLEDIDANVRSAAAEALGKIGSERALGPLVERLEDIDANVRKAAVGALCHAADEESRRLLSRDLDGIFPFIDPREPISDEWVHRAAATLALGTEVVRARYEKMVPRFRLRLSWK